MFDDLSVTENIFSGHFLKRGKWLLDWAAMRARAAELLRNLESDIRPDTPLKALSVAQKHIVEIARALSHDSSVVIMDEPTAALGVAQTAMVLDLVRRLADRGLAVLLVSHNLNDVFEVADRLAVLHLGRMVSQGPAAEYDRQIVVDLMTTGTSTREVSSSPAPGVAGSGPAPATEA